MYGCVEIFKDSVCKLQFIDSANISFYRKSKKKREKFIYLSETKEKWYTGLDNDYLKEVYKTIRFCTEGIQKEDKKIEIETKSKMDINRV